MRLLPGFRFHARVHLAHSQAKAWPARYRPDGR